MSIVDQIISWLEYLSQTININFFVVIGAFLEEIIAPIPSPFVMTTAAVIAKAQQFTMVQLITVVIVASIAKTMSSCLFYLVANKLGDLIIDKFGKFIGLSHKLIDQMNAFLTGTWVDDFLIVVARALPFIPTSLVSAGAGIIKYDIKSFALMTFFGIIIRDALYLWVGYFGWTQLENIWQQIKGNQFFIVLLGLVLIFVIWLLFKLKDYLFDKFINLKKQSTEDIKK
jgi:membrane protein DedA with SNARE-associated domain